MGRLKPRQAKPTKWSYKYSVVRNEPEAGKAHEVGGAELARCEGAPSFGAQAPG
ncbi:MAG: hypothetical protein ACLFWL_15270 [Candidatus Brocadiia bacterium]